jgi:hypothetical protein
VVTSEEFLEQLDARKQRGKAPAAPPEPPEQALRERLLSEEERAQWQEAFGAIESDPDVRETLRGNVTDLTDQRIAEIERELEREP